MRFSVNVGDGIRVELWEEETVFGLEDAISHKIILKEVEKLGLREFRPASR